VYCRKCGKQLPDDSKFCDACGTAMILDSSLDTAPATPAAKPPVYQAEAEIARAGAEVARAGAEVARAKADMAKATTGAAVSDISPKSRLAATLLAFFLGIFGAHRFYVGRYGSAAGMLVLTILFFVILGVTGTAFRFGFALAMVNIWALGIATIPLIAVGIWALVDFIVILCGRMKDGQGARVKKWLH
jgi:TM2 domain-containing membrane protein YozV